MRNVCFYLLCLFLIACKTEKPFFEFDEVYHYQINEKDERKYFDKNSKISEIDKADFKKIIMGESYPSSLSDQWYLEEIEKFYPKKQKITADKLEELSCIFSERSQKKELFTACDPMFRNVFIFKKQGNIVGISKICFGCLREHTIGTNRNTSNFGSKNEYERLSELVR